ncbi:AI-2E family transporter [Deltaproteobacteria bacterium Smac51]|nr:AI-2E family transporter [Deltaproteobacteria bacterium Smac51]
MSFDIRRFAYTNKVILIWTAFAALMYIFRDMFGLVFITYIMCFITHGLTQKLHREAGLHRRLMIVVIYIMFTAAIVGFIFFMIPRLLNEARNFTEQLPRTLTTIDTWIDSHIEDNSSLEPLAERIKHMLTPEQMIIKGWAIGKGTLEMGLHYISWFFLGLLFSFLIMMDLPRLTRSVRELRFTRLASVYEETADSVILFAKVVGENFRAQIMISALNTTLTAIGLQILGIQGAVLLCTLVFICGLIPVLGVFISSVPIVLMAVNSGGITLGLWAGVMIIIIHMLEAYVLNPRIVSAVMHINPVLTLIILYIAHSLIGMWGMLLGVPISVYIYRQVIIGITARKKEEAVARNSRPEIIAAEAAASAAASAAEAAASAAEIAVAAAEVAASAEKDCVDYTERAEEKGPDVGREK